MNHNKKNLSGFGLVEIIVSLAIIPVLLLGIYGLIIFSLKITAENKMRILATGIANQAMEQARNLPYDRVGLTTGIPNGDIPTTKSVIKQGSTFIVRSAVSFFDDPFDGTEADGTDLLGQDYKIVTMEVSWSSNLGQKSVTVFSKIIPRTEENSPGGGILRIYVVDANGNPVQGAAVKIVNSKITPSVDFEINTDDSGRVNLPGAMPSYESYEITVSKNNYSTDKTHTRNASNPVPTKPHLTVVAGEKTEQSFSIDKLGILDIESLLQNLPIGQRINNDSSGQDQINPVQAMSLNGNRYFVWQDYRSASDSKIYAQKYNQGWIKQWPLDIVVSPANNQVLPDTDIDRLENLYVCWNDNSNGNQDVYIKKLSAIDGSNLWSGAKINTTADSKDQTESSMTIQEDGPNDYIYVTWSDNRNDDGDVFLQAFSISRSTLFPQEVMATLNSTGKQSQPMITSSPDAQPVIAWTDDRNGNLDIYAQKFNSSGNKIWTSDLLLNKESPLANQHSPAIVISQDNFLFTAWTDDRNGNLDIYAQKFNSSGTPIWTNDLLISSASSSAKQHAPSIAIDTSGAIFISWTDERLGNQDIYATKIDTDGNMLWPNDIFVGYGYNSSNQHNGRLIINTSTNKPSAVWQDDRDGNFDIYATDFDYPDPSTIYAGSLPLIIKSSTRIGENPVIPKILLQVQTDTQGKVSVPTDWDQGYSITINPASSSKHIIYSTPIQPIPLLPDQTKNIQLYVK
jgi:type II secretory pathway pseudopilin PulG